jgi:NADPH:quinone reductase-like Zn-dependent oxidoreductase
MWRIAYRTEFGGAFAEYVVADADLVISLPDHVSFEDGATVPLASLTACQMLYQSLNLPTSRTPLTDPLPVSSLHNIKPNKLQPVV